MTEKRMIDANALYEDVPRIKLTNGSALGRHSGMADAIAQMIQDAPTIDPESLRPVARLEPVDPESDIEFKCSKCEGVISTDWDGSEYFEYCPYRGARTGESI